MVTLEIGQLYGMNSINEVLNAIKELQDSGMSDADIQAVLDRSKDSTCKGWGGQKMKVTFIDKKTATFGDMCIGDTFTRGGDTVYMRVYEWGNHNAMPLNGGNSGMAVKFDLDDEIVPCEAKLTVERG